MYTHTHTHKSQDYKARGVQLILSNPSPRVVRLLDRSGVLAKIGRETIYVRVHDAVMSCKTSMQMLESGTFSPRIWHSEAGAPPAARTQTVHVLPPLPPGETDPITAVNGRL